MTVAAAGICLVPLPPSGERPPFAVLEQAAVLLNEEIAPAHHRLRLRAPRIAFAALPGQFVMLSVVREGETLPVLPRPMALYDWDAVAGTVDIVYRVVGRGTSLMSGFQAGESMVTVGPLGRAFTLRSSTRRLLLLGRGIGTCSLTALGRAGVRRGVALEVVVSARSASALVGVELFRSLGAQVWSVTDDDGSSDVARLRDLLSRRLEVAPAEQIAVCGSERLLLLAAELSRGARALVEVSLEAHMACGLGYCHGCASGQRGLAEESPLVCKDGPVFSCELLP